MSKPRRRLHRGRDRESFPYGTTPRGVETLNALLLCGIKVERSVKTTEDGKTVYVTTFSAKEAKVVKP